jgi:ADP-ribose pyrophosphatase
VSDREPPSSLTLSDRPERWPVISSATVLETPRVISVRRDEVRSPGDGVTFERDVVVHPGAVGIVALDEEERVLLVSQYRHPVGHRLLEIPAGLLDVPGESYPAAAARELYEEAHVRAADWRVLVDIFTSPGMATESTRVYLARGLSAVAAGERHVGVHEEADMPVTRARLADLVAAVLAGQLHNPLVVSGVLATWAARQGTGYDSLRPVDAAWDARAAQPG